MKDRDRLENLTEDGMILKWFVKNRACVNLIQLARDIYLFYLFMVYFGPPLWSSGHSFWLQIQRSRVRFPALPHFLRSSGSGTGSTQPREDN
jgi:hypothetical protein